MEGFSLLIYVYTALGIMTLVRIILGGVAVLAAVLYFMKRA